jgi:hypothetical protein
VLILNDLNVEVTSRPRMWAPTREATGSAARHGYRLQNPRGCRVRISLKAEVSMHIRLLLVVLATTLVTFGDPISWRDDFESGDFRGGQWKPGSDKAVVNKASADTGKFGVELLGNTSLEKSYNASGLRNLILSFACRTEWLDSEDRILVDWYDGDRWTRMGEAHGDEWKRVQFKLGKEAHNNPFLKVRIRLSTIAFKGVAYFDDIMISADTDGSRVPVPPADCVPPNEAVNVPVRMKLTWQAGIDAEGYEFVITSNASDVRKGRIERSGTLLKANSYRPGELAGGTTYYWQVNGYNKNGSVDGLVWSFTTTTQPVAGSAKPVANAGGPYAAQPGEVIYLDASGSTDPDDDIVAYDWDLDGDGEFDDALGPRHKLVEKRATARLVRVRVRDAAGATDVDTAVVSVKLDDVIDWMNEQNVSINKSTVRKISGSGWNGGAFSHRALTEDGHLAVRGSWGGKRMIGLSSKDVGPQPFGIDYALYMNDRKLEIFERGQQKGSYGGFRPGEELRIEIDAGDVIYWRENEELRRVEHALPRGGFAMHADIAIETPNAEIMNIRLVMPPPEPPRIAAYSAGDPDNLDTFYGAGDSFKIRFHRATDQAGFDKGQVLDQKMVDRLFSFSPAPGRRYEGSWVSPEIFLLTILEPSAVEPVIGGATVRVAGQRPILHSREALTADEAPSPPLDGHWGSVMVQWADGQGVRIDGAEVARENRREGWDAGARSFRKLVDGAYFETTVTSRGKSRMIGLVQEMGDYHFRALSHAFFLHGSGALEAFQAGAQRGSLGQYAPGDTLRIELHGREVHYLRNGKLLRKALIAPEDLPAHVGAFIQSPGGKFGETLLVLPDPPVPYISEFVASDPDASEAGFTANDTLTIIFDRPTTRPPTALEELFDFQPPLAGDFQGEWLDARRYRITGVGTAPGIGTQTVAPKGTIYHAGSQVAADSRAATLSGSYQHSRDPLPVKNISNTSGDADLWQLVNGSGMRGDTHDTDPGGMWLAKSARPEFQIDLGRVCSVDQLAIWNRNSGAGDAMGRVDLAVSLDGEIWAPVASLQLRAGTGTQPVAGDYVSVHSDCRYLRVSSQAPTAVGLSELRIFGRPAKTHLWGDPEMRATIANQQLEAVVQGGRLCELRNRATGAAFVRIDPASMPANLASLNFSAATTLQSATAESVTTLHTWPDGSHARMTWTLSGDELLLRTDAPLTRLPGIDIVNQRLVTLDFHGYGHTRGRQGRQRPLALIEGKEGGWIVLGDPMGSFDRQPEALATSARELRIRAYSGDWQTTLTPYRAGFPLTPVGKRASWTRDLTGHLLEPNNNVIPEETLLGPITDYAALTSAIAAGYRTIADCATIGMERAVKAGASVLLVDLADVPDAQYRYPIVPLMVRGLPEIDATFSLLDRDMGHPLGAFLLAPYRIGVSTFGQTLDLNKLIK